MGFPRQQYWSGLPCPPPGNLPDQGIKPKEHQRSASLGRGWGASSPRVYGSWTPGFQILSLENCEKKFCCLKPPSFFCFFLKFFNFILAYRQLIMFAILSDAQPRDSAIHVHEPILSQISLPSRLPHGLEDSSLHCTVGPCWLSTLNTALCAWHLTFSLTTPSSHSSTLVIESSFSMFVSLFLFRK